MNSARAVYIIWYRDVIRYSTPQNLRFCGDPG
jgi:hypothetical protein